MNPAALLLEDLGAGRLAREEQAMARYAASRGVPVILATETQLARARIVPPPGAVAVGTVPFVKHALRLLGKSLPDHNPYPP